ncbi:uncharacterized protein LY79DRAFT_215080 [Colletotrichum navitas]|uniref:Uncharacterized protein n=1 Tax=Colletotrichum navitas TaxID=681940 RepID=A0AAD8PYZ5_9PEZI|nr:uncharacterized protein LY79DRAFT_215080 [Colletotrichum navitas]KAK1590600.1 hypothetical protein LY79DRAFT_215080 [Colletotrichum navitas]
MAVHTPYAIKNCRFTPSFHQSPPAIQSRQHRNRNTWRLCFRPIANRNSWLPLSCVAVLESGVKVRCIRLEQADIFFFSRKSVGIGFSSLEPEAGRRVEQWAGWLPSGFLLDWLPRYPGSLFRPFAPRTPRENGSRDLRNSPLQPSTGPRPTQGSCPSRGITQHERRGQDCSGGRTIVPIAFASGFGLRAKAGFRVESTAAVAAAATSQWVPKEKKRKRKKVREGRSALLTATFHEDEPATRVRSSGVCEWLLRRGPERLHRRRPSHAINHRHIERSNYPQPKLQTGCSVRSFHGLRALVSSWPGCLKPTSSELSGGGCASQQSTIYGYFGICFLSTPPPGSSSSLRETGFPSRWHLKRKTYAMPPSPGKSFQKKKKKKKTIRADRSLESEPSRARSAPLAPAASL